MTRINKILLALCAVQLLMAFLIHSRESALSVQPLKALAADFSAKSTTRLAIHSIADDKNPVIVLEKKDQQWLLASHHHYPAQEAKIQAALGQIEGMKTRRPFSTNAARHRQMSVADDDFERKLVLKSDAGELVVYIGKPAGQGKGAVRIGDSPTIHAIVGMQSGTFGIKPVDWLNTVYFKEDSAKIAEIRVVNKQGTFVMKRGDSGWEVTSGETPLSLQPNQQLATSHIDSLVARATHITMTEPGAKASTLGTTPAATVSLTLKPSDDKKELSTKIHTLRIFVDGETITVHEQNNAHSAKLLKSTLNNLLSLNADALRQDPPPAKSP